MTNEEFQKFVVEKLGRIETEIAGIKNHTANLMKFRTEVNAKLDSMMEDNKSIHELLGEHEVSIRTLRRRPV